MLFNEVVGQEAIKAHLIQMAQEQRIPHALLFSGPQGCGKLPMAIAFATYLLCTGEKGSEVCNSCSGCKMTAKLVHPDLHFCFPVIKQKGSSSDPKSSNYLSKWREQILENPYFELQSWLNKMGVENQQAIINVAQSNEIIQSLSIQANQGGYKIMIVWLPELMNEATANKLLKIIEEPPGKAVFILVSEQPDNLLSTIVSRTQRIEFKALPEKTIAQRLEDINKLTTEDAAKIAHSAEGNLIKAIQTISYNKDSGVFFDLFVLLMRLSYQRKIKDMSEWSLQVASWGRERQKNFLIYCQNLIRENFIYNFRQPKMNFMEQKEADFAKNFARFVNEKNVIEIMEKLADAQRDIEQNVNPKMVFFDFSLKMIVLLIQ